MLHVAAGDHAAAEQQHLVLLCRCLVLAAEVVNVFKALCQLALVCDDGIFKCTAAIPVLQWCGGVGACELLDVWEKEVSKVLAALDRELSGKIVNRAKEEAIRLPVV